MTKKSWARGRREATHLVRLEADIYENCKIIADKNKMTLKSWVSTILRNEIITNGKLMINKNQNNK